MKKVEIFTDGACRGNPGVGGWGVIMRCQGSEKTMKGAVGDTTNNRMELTAVIEALKALKEHCNIDVTTDSQYVRLGITQWLVNWKKNNWRTSQKKPVKNQDLWQLLEALSHQHTIRWHWVKGHAGHVENERADQLANEAIDAYII